MLKNSPNDLNILLQTQRLFLYNFILQENCSMLTLKLTSNDNLKEELNNFIKKFVNKYWLENFKYLAVLDFNSHYTEINNGSCIHLVTNLSPEDTYFLNEYDDYESFFMTDFPTSDMYKNFFHIYKKSCSIVTHPTEIIFTENLREAFSSH